MEQENYIEFIKRDNVLGVTVIERYKLFQQKPTDPLWWTDKFLLLFYTENGELIAKRLGTGLVWRLCIRGKV